MTTDDPDLARERRLLQLPLLIARERKRMAKIERQLGTLQRQLDAHQSIVIALELERGYLEPESPG